ncbi:MAG: hypothetical protein AABX66_04360 [Nanoarchaeota archaeon]
MEKDIDRIAKNAETDIVIRIDDFGGKRGLTIREFVKSERYTGFTKAGTRIPADKFEVFKEAINSINPKDLQSEENALVPGQDAPSTSKPQKSFSQKTKKPVSD